MFVAAAGSFIDVKVGVQSSLRNSKWLMFCF